MYKDRQTIELTEPQKKKAKDLLDRIDSDLSPKDILTQWDATLQRTHLDWDDAEYKYIPTRKIFGTESYNTTRLDSGRLRSVVTKLLEGRFKKEHRFPPNLCQIDGKYYVDADGNHRTIAFKYIGIPEMYAEVVRYY